MDAHALIGDLSKVGILIALIALVLGIMTWTGMVNCRAVPYWCDVYWGVMGFWTGGPKVLIVYGDYGLGNPIGGCNENGCSLQELLANPEFVGVHADTMHVDRVNVGNLRNYHLVIVERARKISTKQLKDFIEYYNTGGRIVWTGDAGTELGRTIMNERDEYLYLDERYADTNSHKIIGPWARKDGDKMVSFDYILSANFVGNYCGLANCLDSKPNFVGALEPEPSGKHPLIRGMSSTLPLYVFKGEDFALVQTISGGITTEVLTLDRGSKLKLAPDANTGWVNPNILVTGADLNVSKTNPMIITSGIGGRMVYYAMPPELYANPKLLKHDRDLYLLPLENMFYGLIYG